MPKRAIFWVHKDEDAAGCWSKAHITRNAKQFGFPCFAGGSQHSGTGLYPMESAVNHTEFEGVYMFEAWKKMGTHQWFMK